MRPCAKAKKMGINSVPRIVAASMPENTVTPRETRLEAPAPVASTSGRTPSKNENAVIKTARNRSLAAFSAASNIVCPSSRS